MSLQFACGDPVDRAAGLQVATSAVARGDLVVLPTDTVYGVATDAFSPAGIERIRVAKARGRDLPVPVMVGHPRTVEGLALGLDDAGRALLAAFWPGPLTVVVTAQPSLSWDLGDSHGTVSLRMPLHPLAIELLRATGPLAVTSANRSGLPAPLTMAEAQAQLGDAVAAYLDGGDCLAGPPSTVVDLTGPVPVVLRDGALGLEVLREVVPETLAAPA